ncbi:MAG: hypothetical protein H8E17_16485, partial [Deltaproteobacteria bacterium]|nr:hypothetical protein [Deltaproteobacteria bacterium]
TLRHCEQYQNRARVLYIRQTYKGLMDFEDLTRELFGMIYGKAARYNGSEHIWKLPNSGYLELGQLEGPGDYAKYQGRSFTLLLVDEAAQYAVPDLLDKLKSNLRGPKDMPIRTVMAANPGDPGHHWIAQRYVFKAAPWVPFFEEKSKKTWVYAPSTFLDNPFIDQDEYKRQLEASCPTDPELLRAWLEGDWTVARGAFFSSVIEESRNAVDPWLGPPEVSQFFYNDWKLFLAHDYGSSAPSVTYVVAVSPGREGPDGKFYPRDSLILIDELSTNEPGSLTKGMGWTVPILAEAIRDFVKPWGMKRPAGVADDACFASHGHATGSIASEFRREGVYFLPAKKSDRRTGWEVVRRLLQDAGKPDVPGLYIARNCEYFWATVPFLGRDPKKTDDVDSRGPDHGADACRYGCMGHRPRGGISQAIW